MANVLDRPLVACRNFLKKIKCQSACCGGTLNIQEADGRKASERTVLRRIASGWLQRSRRTPSTCKKEIPVDYPEGSETMA